MANDVKIMSLNHVILNSLDSEFSTMTNALLWSFSPPHTLAKTTPRCYKVHVKNVDIVPRYKPMTCDDIM